MNNKRIRSILSNLPVEYKCKRIEHHQLRDGRRLEGLNFFIKKFFQLFSADIVLVHFRYQVRTHENICLPATYNRTRRILGRVVVPQAHRLGHARRNGSVDHFNETKLCTYASRYGCASASSTVIRFLGSNVCGFTFKLVVEGQLPRKNLLKSLSRNQQRVRLHLGRESQTAVSCGTEVHECSREIFAW